MNRILENKILVMVLAIASMQLGSWCGTVQADPIIDQQQTEWSCGAPGNPDWPNVSGSHDGFLGQSFTAGVTGLLTKIEVNINCIYRGAPDSVDPEEFNSTPTLNIYEGHFVPAGTYGDLLYSGPVDLSAVPSAYLDPFSDPTWYTFDLVSPLHLTESDQYTFLISGPDQTQHLINILDPYPGGCWFAKAHVDQTTDILFRTWMEIDPVPQNTPPVADAGGPYLGAVGTDILFDGTGSSDPDSDPLTYAWGFGDSGTDTGAAPTYSYAASGIYDVCLTVNDGTVDSDSVCTIAVVYDPSAGFVTGGGWIDSEPGYYTPDETLEGKATFGFVSRYKKGATEPTGQTEFVFQAGDLNFHSSSYQWLVVTGSDYAKFKGTGTINGEGPYKFMIWAGDGPDTFRIKIWTEDSDGVEDVVYDNVSDQGISGGSIVIHAK